MKRRLFSFLLGAALLAAPANAVTVTLDGAPLDLGPTPIYDDATYVPFRAFIETLYPDATVSWEAGQAQARGTGLRLTAVPNETALTYNGARTALSLPIRLEEGRTLVPIRPLANLLGLAVDWDGERGMVLLTTAKDHPPIPEAIPEAEGSFEAEQPSEPVTPSEAEPVPGWSEEDLYWLARIISAESQGECWEGKIAVGNVVLNRVASPDFPDTIYGVIFDMRWGGQFAPVRNGTIYNEPTEESVRAALAVLRGENTVGDSLYFIAPNLTSNHWTMENRDYVTTIGVHWFYK